MTTTLAMITKQQVEILGWKAGTSLENRVMFWLSRAQHIPVHVKQQYNTGRFRLDFAWPLIKVALEVDGWHHRSPEGSAHDAERDSWLRSEGWIVFRIDDRFGDEAFRNQFTRVSRLIHMIEADH